MRALLLSGGLLLLSTSARAEGSASAVQHQDSTSTPPQDWRFAGHIGLFANDEHAGYVAGASFLYRTGIFEAGPLVEAGSTITDYSYGGVAGLAGLGLRPSPTARLELLAVLGEHFYEGVGRDYLLGDDPGANGRTGYAGGRFCTVHKYPRIGELGFCADFQDDVSRQRVRYTFPATGNGFFDGGGTGDHVLGTWRIGLTMTFGVTHDMM